jgi:hypothetical protein
MTTEEFQAWAGEHCRVFGLSVEESGTVLSWEPYFVASGFHKDDLADTTAHFAKIPGELARLGKPAKYLGKTSVHLAAIEAYIREQTARRLGEESSRFAAEHGTCLVCYGTGFVSVPHLAGISNGRWVGAKAGGLAPQFYTQAVACSCALGRWKADKQGQRRGGEVRRIMTLEAYEHQNPDWKRQLAAREEAQREKVRVLNPKLAAAVDAALAKLQHAKGV